MSGVGGLTVKCLKIEKSKSNEDLLKFLHENICEFDPAHYHQGIREKEIKFQRKHILLPRDPSKSNEIKYFIIIISICE